MFEPAPNVLPRMPGWVRFAIGGFVLACFAYVMFALPGEKDRPESGSDVVEKIVRVPELDEQLLAQAKDTVRADRLVLEKEPLRHLLSKAIDVGPTVAAALNMPATPVPVAELRTDIAKWRHRWIWYEGKLAQLTKPGGGHPIKGYEIHEAIVELADGEHVIATFSVPSKQFVEVGDWVRVEGYLLKLRDVTYPTQLARIPMLVGRTMFRDYEDWPAVTALDAGILDQINDSTFYTDDPPWRDVEEDQYEPLWHLGAYVRDTADQRTLADWRKIGVLDTGEIYDDLIAGDVERGQPLRIFGVLRDRRTIAAPPNPANIKFWTSVLVEAQQFDGRVIPVWVPKRVRDLPRRCELEVRGHYYRWWAYHAGDGRDHKVPLFIAEDLHRFELDTEKTMREAGLWVAGFVLLLIVLIVYGQWRMSRSALRHSQDMDRRRRRRRAAQSATPTGD